MRIKSFRWYGGKNRIVHILNALIPSHSIYVEPFAGSAALLLNHPKSGQEIINDLDSDIAHFFATLADREKGKALVERLCNLEYGQEFFDSALQAQKNQYKGLDEVEKAVVIYVIITQSYNTLRKFFGKGAFKDTYSYRADIRFNIPLVYERLQGVRVLNKNGIELLEQVIENPTVFVFADPPYRKDLRGKGADKAYAYEMSDNQQVHMLKVLQRAKCKVMLCGYRAEEGIDLYDKFLLPYGYKCYKVADVVKSCQNKKNRDVGHEFVWINYQLPVYSKYIISMKEYTSLVS